MWRRVHPMSLYANGLRAQHHISGKTTFRTGLPPRVVNDESHEQLRVHSRASGTRLIRRSVRYVCCSPMFPSVLSLGSTNSAPSRPGLFVGFNAIMKRSDFSCNVLHRLRLLAFPMRTAP